jgi:hypothetical protein
MGRMLKPRRLCHIHGFLEIAMEKGIADIDLMDSLACRNTNGEHRSNSYRLNYGAVSFWKIDPRLLVEPFGY